MSFLRPKASFRFSLLLAGAAACLAACEEEVPTVDCDTVTIPSYAEINVFNNSCNSCHSSTLSGGSRHGAPSSVNYDTYEAAVANIEEAMEEVAEGAMPTGGVGLSTVDEDELFAWGQCGTPQ